MRVSDAKAAAWSIDPMPTEVVDSVTPMGDGFHIYVNFDNGYGASVVSHEYCYGGREGLAEVAVVDHDRNLLYDTPVTNDVIGWLDLPGLTEVLAHISALDAEDVKRWNETKANHPPEADAEAEPKVNEVDEAYEDGEQAGFDRAAKLALDWVAARYSTEVVDALIQHYVDNARHD